MGELNQVAWHGFIEENWSDFNLMNLSVFKNGVEVLDSKSRIWVWGGATKGVLFLKHLLAISPSNFEKVVAVVDVNPKKQSLFTPSTNLPIISPNEMFAGLKDDDYVIVMNPNYLEEVRNNLENNTSLEIDVDVFMPF